MKRVFVMLLAIGALAVAGATWTGEAWTPVPATSLADDTDSSFKGM